MAYKEDSGTYRLLSLDIKDRKDKDTTWENDYREHRRTLLESVEAGRRLEEEYERLDRKLDSKASQRAIDDAFARIKELEDARQRQSGVLQFFKAMVLLAAGAVMSAFVQRHKGP